MNLADYLRRQFAYDEWANRKSWPRSDAPALRINSR